MTENREEIDKMRKRFCALLLALCLACTMLVIPASASGSNTAVQTAMILGGLTSDQAANPDTALTGASWHGF